MIYATGDLHGTMEINKLKRQLFPEGWTLTKEDFVIILGDFGLILSPTLKMSAQNIWDPNTADQKTEQEEYWLNCLSSKPWTTLFLDGNHENFDRLLAYPIRDFHGGKASQIHDSVWYLRRGEVFELSGKKCFVMGGAASIDKEWREPGKSWWPQEVPSYADFKTAQMNLERFRDRVDLVFTHTCPSSIKSQLPLDGEWSNVAEKMEFVDPTEGMLEGFLAQLKFKHWYFAHFHLDLNINDRFTSVFNSVVRVA